MLTIRDEQWQAFSDDAEKRFERQLVVRMTQGWSDVAAQLGAEGTRRRVKVVLEKARAHGFVAHLDQERFVHLGFMVGEDFDTSKVWGRSVLGWDDDAETKLAALEKAAQRDAIARAEAGE